MYRIGELTGHDTLGHRERGHVVRVLTNKSRCVEKQTFAAAMTKFAVVKYTVLFTELALLLHRCAENKKMRNRRGASKANQSDLAFNAHTSMDVILLETQRRCRDVPNFRSLTLCIFESCRLIITSTKMSFSLALKVFAQ
jgi:hypothetical protein